MCWWTVRIGVYHLIKWMIRIILFASCPINKLVSINKGLHSRWLHAASIHCRHDVIHTAVRQCIITRPQYIIEWDHLRTSRLLGLIIVSCWTVMSTSTTTTTSTCQQKSQQSDVLPDHGDGKQSDGGNNCSTYGTATTTFTVDGNTYLIGEKWSSFARSNIRYLKMLTPVLNCGHHEKAEEILFKGVMGRCILL